VANPDEEREEQLLLLAALMAWFRRESERLAQALRDDVITLAAWLVGMRLLIKRLHTSAALITGEVDEALVAARIQEQYGYLDGFAAAIQAGGEGEDEEGLSIAAIIARAALYAGAAWATFWAVTQGRETGQEVRWHTVGDNRCCPDCVALEDRGWMPAADLPTVPGAGDTQCMTNCRCVLEYR